MRSLDIMGLVIEKEIEVCRLIIVFGDAILILIQI